MQAAERTDHHAGAASFRRVERSYRFFRNAGIVWGISILAMELFSFPHFAFEWYRGAPMAIATSGLAFIWAFCALWAGGFRIGRRAITPQTVLRDQTPETFWRGIIIALVAGTVLIGVGIIRLHS